MVDVDDGAFVACHDAAGDADAAACGELGGRSGRYGLEDVIGEGTYATLEGSHLCGWYCGVGACGCGTEAPCEVSDGRKERPHVVLPCVEEDYVWQVGFLSDDSFMVVALDGGSHGAVNGYSRGEGRVGVDGCTDFVVGCAATEFHGEP